MYVILCMFTILYMLMKVVEYMYIYCTSQQACWYLHPGGQNVDDKEPIVLKMHTYFNHL